MQQLASSATSTNQRRPRDRGWVDPPICTRTRIKAVARYMRNPRLAPSPYWVRDGRDGRGPDLYVRRNGTAVELMERIDRLPKNDRSVSVVAHIEQTESQISTAIVQAITALGCPISD